MKPKKAILIFKTLMLATAILAVAASASAVTPRILIAEGRVLLKRSNWSGYRQTSVGASLNPDDLIRPDRGANVIILCPDLTQWKVPGGRIWGAISGCPTGVTRGRRSGLVPGTLGGRTPFLPYIISPRRTLVLNSQPTLRWNAVPGATRYTVHLSRPTGVIWRQEVTETEVVYPGVPSLEPGVPYSLIVEADTGASSQKENASGLEFVRLTDADAHTVQADIERLTQQGLADEAEALAIASFYSDYTLSAFASETYNLTTTDIETYSLTAKAIEVLEALVNQGSQTPTVHRMLGDLYWQSGLQLLAEAQYMKVVELAKTTKDLEERADAQVRLAEIYVAVGDLDKAYQWLRQARITYAFLGDQERITVIKEQLDDLNRQRGKGGVPATKCHEKSEMHTVSGTRQSEFTRKHCLAGKAMTP